MDDRNVRLRRAMARAMAGILVVVVVSFAGSVGAQDSPRIGLKIRTLTAELRKQHKLS